MRILVTDSNTRPALAAVRALGALGHEVICAGTAHPSLASVSRFAAGFERCPSPATDADAFVTALLDIAHRRQIQVVLPITEITTLLTAAHQHELPDGCHFPFPEHEVVANASNKAFVITRAQGLGIPTPRTTIIESLTVARAAVEGLQFPIVIKPARSRVRFERGWLSTGVTYASDSTELEKRLADLPAPAYPVLLQERIDGPGVGVFVCLAEDEPIALFAHRRLREKPPSGGVSVLCESTPLDPTAVDHAIRLLRSLKWRGVAMVEFKQDDRDGSLRLMEINGRFWGSLQLAIDAGVNFPGLAIALAVGDVAHTTPARYRVGIRTRWLKGDADSLLAVMFRSRRGLHLRPHHPGRLRSLWQFVTSFSRAVLLETERAGDPAPARFEWRTWLLGTH